MLVRGEVFKRPGLADAAQPRVPDIVHNIKLPVVRMQLPCALRCTCTHTVTHADNLIAVRPALLLQSSAGYMLQHRPVRCVLRQYSSCWLSLHLLQEIDPHTAAASFIKQQPMLRIYVELPKARVSQSGNVGQHIQPRPAICTENKAAAEVLTLKPAAALDSAGLPAARQRPVSSMPTSLDADIAHCMPDRSTSSRMPSQLHLADYVRAAGLVQLP